MWGFCLPMDYQNFSNLLWLFTSQFFLVSILSLVFCWSQFILVPQTLVILNSTPGLLPSVVLDIGLFAQYDLWVRSSKHKPWEWGYLENFTPILLPLIFNLVVSLLTFVPVIVYLCFRITTELGRREKK